jgi:glycerophosphoryl diester phosphodiesterase
LAPENTAAAFAQAAAMGVDGCELDVRLSRDGEVVVIHDATLDRTTDASGPVSALTAAELARVDAGCHFGPETGHPWRGRGEGVPRLADILAAHPGLPFIVELKGDDPALAVAATEVARDRRALDRICFGGFSDATVAAARRAAPSATTSGATEEIRAALYRSYFWMSPGTVPYQAFQVPETSNGTRIVSRRFVRAARRAGIVVHVWTVNSAADVARLKAWGVDGVITDRPDMALAAGAARPEA